MRRPDPFSLPPQYADMRAHCPVQHAELPTGRPVWLVARHGDVKALLTDPRISADRTKPGFPFLTAEAEYLAAVRVFVGMDAPEHGPHRRMFLPEFTAKRVQRLRAPIQADTDARLSRMIADGPPADLVTALALPIPALAVGRILGVPADRRDWFEHTTVALMSPQVRGTEAAAALFGELVEFMKELVRSKHTGTDDDLTSRVIRDHVHSGELDVRALTISLVLILLAGYETTANTISLGMLTLLRHPDQLRELRTDPGLLPGAVDELLRYLSVAELATTRTATADIDVGGTTIRAGEGVIPLAAAANRDPEVFPDPERFDIRRGTQGHLAFGHGAHACIGANLAKLELEIVFAAVLQRLPELALACPLDEVAVKYEAVLFGLDTLPITW